MQDIDFSKMTKKEKLEYIDLLDEKERRLKSRRKAFIPNAAQDQIMRSPKPFKWVFSGNGMGKTAYLAFQVECWASGYNPVLDKMTNVPCRIAVVLDKPDKVADTWIPELNKWFNLDETIKKYDKRGKPYVSRLEWRNGSEIIFYFHEQERMTFESIEVDYIAMDEPPPRHAYIGLLRGMRNTRSQPELVCVGTPIDQRWLREEVYEPWQRGELPDTECFRFSSDVNKDNVNWEFLQRSVFSKYSEQEIRMRRHGEFFDVGGLALAHLFDRRTHLVEPFKWRAEWPCVVAIDPAQSKPHVACLLGAHPNGSLYYIKETALKAAPRDFARHLREFYWGYNVVDVVCDSLGSTEGTGGDGLKSFIDVLNEEGVYARSTTYNEKNDEAWLSSIQDKLLIPKDDSGEDAGKPGLLIFAGNDMIVREIENVSWVKDKKNDMYRPKLEISKLDSLACLKYALASNLQFRGDQIDVYTPPMVSFRSRLNV